MPSGQPAHRRPTSQGDSAGPASDSSSSSVGLSSFVSARSSSSRRSTVSVIPGCRTFLNGSMAATGSAKRTHSPASGLVAKVTPWSTSERWAGPAVFGIE